MAAGYCEPFAGMLGVLLQREPARREIVADLDGDVINWWRVVRDHPAELGDMLDHSPAWSAALFGEAVENLEHPEPVKRAYYFTIAMCWVRGRMIGRVRESVNHPRNDYFISRVNRQQPAPDDGIKRQRGVSPITLARSPRITMLADRLRGVELEIRAAEKIVEYYAAEPDFVFYLDPPYPTANVRGRLYTFNDISVAEWAERLRAVRGFVAVSGRGDEWALLENDGWLRHSRDDEALWTNYAPAGFWWKTLR